MEQPLLVGLVKQVPFVIMVRFMKQLANRKEGQYCCLNSVVEPFDQADAATATLGQAVLKIVLVEIAITEEQL